ncbi:hypothetical protein ACQKCJ_08920 [Flavobacterium sp. NPDC079362]|uniref:Abi-alpha family protein n=1 Tax=Flavobacterium sp. NPDC079362 TaxID=3390566 RepID=UPI003CFDE769
MENKKIDITSTAIEKGIDLIGGFIEKLVGSSLEEAGLYLSEKVKIRRLNNQIKIFSDAKKIAEQNNITIKQINLKTIVPLLEFSSLEEDETLQKKWSNLIVNFSDSSKVFESSIFPFILNQISTNELKELERVKDVGAFKTTELNLKASEISNITRLGLIGQVGDSQSFGGGKFVIPTFTFSQITALGVEFVNCCSI